MHQYFVVERSVVILAVGLAGFLAGCSSPVGTGEAEVSKTDRSGAEDIDVKGDSVRSPAVPEDSGEVDDDAADGNLLDAGSRVRLSPVQEALGEISDPERLSEIYRHAYQGHADITQRCLAEEGFGGYVVLAWEWPRPEEFLDIGTGHEMEELGYGIAATQRSGLEFIVQDPFGATSQSSPNSDFLGQLTEDEFTIFNRTRGICRKEAWEEFPLPGVPDTFAEEFVDLDIRIENDPRTIRAWDEWSACMQRQGHIDVFNRSDAVAMVEQGGIEIDLAIERIAVEVANGVREVSASDVDELFEQIEELRDFELLLATDDLGCAEETQVDDAIFEVRVELEEIWIEENANRIAFTLSEVNDWWTDLDG